MFKKVGISLMAALMMSSVALACDLSSIDDEDFLCEFSLVDNGGNKQECKQEERKVLKFDKEVVKKYIMEDLPNFTSSNADDIVNVLGRLDVRLQPVLDEYIANRTISTTFNVEGLTTKMVMDKYNLDFWHGLESMQNYLDDHEWAKRTRNDLTPVRYHQVWR